MSKRIQDMVGQRFGNLEVQSFSHKDSISRNYFICICDCGNEKIVQQSNLLSGRSASCGCLRRKAESKDQKEIICNSRSDIFKSKNSFRLAEPSYVRINDTIIVKETGKRGTVNETVSGDKPFEFTMDDGSRGIAFSVNEVWLVVCDQNKVT